MKPLLNFEILLPILIIILQLLVILLGSIMILRKLKLLKQPLAGMEYSQAIFAASFLFAVFLIATIPISAILQTYKTYSAQHVSIFSPLLNKSGQYFLVVLFFEILLTIIVTIVSRLFQYFGKGLEEIRTGNVPLAMLMGVIVIGFGITLMNIGKELVEWVVPRYINISS